MTNLTYSFWVYAVSCGVVTLGLVLYFQGKRERIAAICVMVVALGFGYAVLTDLLSRPKPVGLEWGKGEEVTLVSALLVEGRGIYLWILPPGTTEPRSYVLPWDRETAEQLQAAMRQGEQQGTRTRMRRLEPSLDDQEPLFYNPPQPAAPPKEDE